MQITASIVTYNNSNEISNILKSLYETGINIDITVVDNFSSDETVNIVKEKFPSVNIIQLGKNIGFGAAHNKCISSVESRYHIIINPDIIICKNDLQQMIDYMENNADTVMISPKIANFDGSIQQVPRIEPRFKYVLSSFFEKKSKYFKKQRDIYTLANYDKNEPIDIGFCSGCFMFCRTEALKKSNGFDPRFFLYFEDADLTKRMKKIGRTTYLPYVKVTHEWKRDNKKSFKIFKISVISMIKYFLKWNKLF